MCNHVSVFICGVGRGGFGRSGGVPFFLNNTDAGGALFVEGRVVMVGEAGINTVSAFVSSVHAGLTDMLLAFSASVILRGVVVTPQCAFGAGGTCAGCMVVSKELASLTLVGFPH